MARPKNRLGSPAPPLQVASDAAAPSAYDIAEHYAEMLMDIERVKFLAENIFGSGPEADEWAKEADDAWARAQDIVMGPKMISEEDE